MAKRKRKKRQSNPIRRRRSPARKTVRRAARRMSAFNFHSALKNMVPIQIGMFSAKWAAKRFGEGASETDPESWNWASYLKGAAGAAAAGMLANMVKPGWGQKILEGGLNLMAYKAIQNELIAGNDWAVSQFGADEDDYVPTEYLLTGDDEDEYSPMFGAAEDDEGLWGLSEDGEPIPVDDAHRLPEVSYDGYGESALVEPGRLGSTLEPVGPMGGDPFREAYEL